MKNRSEKIQKLTLLGLCASVALLLSYVEAMIPPLFSAIPGIKMGLPNVVIVFVLYRYGVRDASFVSVVRLIIVAMLFGTVTTFMYSLAGAVLSLLVMAILKKLDFLSTVGVSVAGGVCHNIGQIIAASFLMKTSAVFSYLPYLVLSGVCAGIFCGTAARFLVKCMDKLHYNYNKNK
jgi:heptaprenyl diphosphate synthase